MSLSGCLPSFDVDDVEKTEESLPPKVTKPCNYQVTAQEIRDLNTFCSNALILPLDCTGCIQFFSRESKVNGKSHVWKAQNMDSPSSKKVSSVVQVTLGSTKHVGRVVHFLAIPVQGNHREFATIQIYNAIEQDSDSGLYFVNTMAFNVTTIPLEFLSVPLVTAIDEENASVLWLLNI